MLTLEPLSNFKDPKLEPSRQDVAAREFEYLAAIFHGNAVYSLITRVMIDCREYCLKLYIKLLIRCPKTNQAVGLPSAFLSAQHTEGVLRTSRLGRSSTIF